MSEAIIATATTDTVRVTSQPNVAYGAASAAEVYSVEPHEPTPRR